MSANKRNSAASIEEKHILEDIFKQPFGDIPLLKECKANITDRLLFVSPPKPSRMLLESHENEEDFFKRIFAKKQYRAFYKRPAVDFAVLLGC